jgi:hypothetical protein
MVLRGHAYLLARMNCVFYVLLTLHLDAILGNDQLDALFLNVFILCTKTSVATKVVISPQKTTLHYIVSMFILPSV